MHIIHVKTLPLQTEFGKMPEWPNGTVSKTVVRVTVPRVRIPLSPLKPKTLGSQIKTSPVKSTFYGTLSIYPVDNRKTLKCPLQTKFRYKIEHFKSKIVTINVTH